MSIITIDPQTYDNILTKTIAHFINSGMDLIAARALAKEQMEASFRKADDRDVRYLDDGTFELDLKEHGIYD